MLDWLPTEIVAYILELAYYDRCLDGELWFTDCSTRIGVGKFQRKDLFALLEIDSRSRSIACEHPPIWRRLAEYILDSVVKDNITSSLPLLSLCAERSKNTLTRLNLDEFVMSTSCQKIKLDMLKIIAPSAPSFKYIHMALVDENTKSSCNCDHCSGITHPLVGKGKEVNEAALDLLNHATSLQHLVLTYVNYWPLIRRVSTLQAMQARPKVFQLEDRTTGEFIPLTTEVTARLASNASTLHLGTIRSGAAGRISSGELSFIVGAASLSVQNLHLWAEEHELGLKTILQHQLPLLQKLCVHPGYLTLGHMTPLYDPPTIPSSKINPAPTRSYFPALRVLEGPAWLLHFINAPQLQTLAVRQLDHINDERVLLDHLQRWTKIENLLLHCEGINVTEATHMFQRVLRRMTPANSSTYLCPNLQRLSLMARPLVSPDWLSPEGFDVEPHKAKFPIDPRTPMDHVSFKGSDLLEFEHSTP